MIRLALISNWNDKCGIAEYTKYLIDALYPKIDDLKIFAEINNNPAHKSTPYDVDYCWKRGISLSEMIKKVLEYKPTHILVQHEFGIFPKANHFLKMLEDFSEIPLAVTLHSVYLHKDKSISSSAIPNIIVHTNEAKDCLVKDLKRTSGKTFVISHGCIDLGEIKPNFNSTGSPYPLIQFGFGFEYKGSEIVLEAINILKKKHPKFNDIFYLYLLSENPNSKNVHNYYYKTLKEKATSLGVSENFTVQRGFLNIEQIYEYIRTARLSVFPYVTNPNNITYGSTGAARIAIANGNPTIVSDHHLFDDLEGVVPRIKNAQELANEIAKCFSDGNYRKEILRKQRQFILENTWDITADRYKKVLEEIIE